MQEDAGHKSVLIKEVLYYLQVQPGKIYVDVTFGAGGHTRAILEKEPRCTVIALDWDVTVLETFGAPLQQHYGDRLKTIWGNFSQLAVLLKKERINAVDGILADFGTSQIQITQRAGFSVYRDTPLDMRMSPAHQRMTAADVLKTASYEKLCELFWQLGGEGRARKIAEIIVQERTKKPITTTGQLAALIARAVPEKRHYRIHPATKVFQALRIYINKELDNIHSFLIAAQRLLNPEGRLVCISFHSLEDQLVKDFFKDQERAGTMTIVTPKIVVPQLQEIQENPSSRSAKLRAAQKNAISV